jgi:hypothetical protein
MNRGPAAHPFRTPPSANARFRIRGGRRRPPQLTTHVGTSRLADTRLCTATPRARLASEFDDLPGRNRRSALLLEAPKPSLAARPRIPKRGQTRPVSARPGEPNFYSVGLASGLLLRRPGWPVRRTSRPTGLGAQQPNNPLDDLSGSESAKCPPPRKRPNPSSPLAPGSLSVDRHDQSPLGLASRTTTAATRGARPPHLTTHVGRGSATEQPAPAAAFRPPPDAPRFLNSSADSRPAKVDPPPKGTRRKAFAERPFPRQGRPLRSRGPPCRRATPIEPLNRNRPNAVAHGLEPAQLTGQPSSAESRFT